MNTTSIIFESIKRIYSTPTIEVIQLDNEISLLLASPSLESLPGGPGCAPPAGAPENYDSNPY